MKCFVEITRGWDGKSLKSETIYDDPPINTSLRKDSEVFMGFGRRTSDWISKNKIGPKDGRYWRIAYRPCKNGTKFIIDYGSWTHFGRVTITDEPEKNKTQETKHE